MGVVTFCDSLPAPAWLAEAAPFPQVLSTLCEPMMPIIWLWVLYG
jgi:hypothetical protein